MNKRRNRKIKRKETEGKEVGEGRRRREGERGRGGEEERGAKNKGEEGEKERKCKGEQERVRKQCSILYELLPNFRTEFIKLSVSSRNKELDTPKKIILGFPPISVLLLTIKLSTMQKVFLEILTHIKSFFIRMTLLSDFSN